VVLACTKPDVRLLTGLLAAPDEPYRRLWTCGLHRGVCQDHDILLAGPVLGAPQAAMVLEKLAALGAQSVVVLGWCGSLRPEVALGHLLLPAAAFGGDGTSPHYAPAGPAPRAHAGLLGVLEEKLQELSRKERLTWHAGPVWTTDAVYRETAQFVARCQARGALAVEMELAALFAVGACRGVAVAGLLVVSDELFTLSWRSGARSPQCRTAREAAARLALAALVAWETP
jgi:uridine phosphorylase